MSAHLLADHAERRTDFPLMAASSGGYPFAFFAAMMVLQFFVVLFVYPETKGIRLEDMNRELGIR